MKNAHLLLSLLAAGVVACGEKTPPPPAPAPKVEAVKPAAAVPMPPAAPSAAPASAGQDAKAEEPKK